MANIINVSNYSKNDNVASTKKISFDVGEVFSAQILGGDTDSGEVTLRTSDGWKFNAKVENYNQIQNFSGNAKFVVDGVKDGKIIIKVVDVQEKKSDNDQAINNELLNKLGLADSKENIDMLKMMIKHNMPLTKENISKMKSIIDFKKDLNYDLNKADEFITKFFDSKNVNVDDREGKVLYSKLKDFFEELKGFSSEDILTFLENKIDLNEENIKSFNNLFKGENSLYKELESINKLINMDNFKGDNKLNVQANAEELKNQNTNKDISEAIKNHNENVESNKAESENNIKPNLNIDSGKSAKSMSLEEIINFINKSGKNISEGKKSNLINNIKILDNLEKVLQSSVSDNKAIFSSNNEEVINNIKDYILENASDLQNISSKDVISTLMSKIEPDLKLSSNDINDIFTSLQGVQIKDDGENLTIKQGEIKNTESNTKVVNETPSNAKINESLDKVKINETANLIKNIVSSGKEQVRINSAENVKEQINLKVENMKNFISSMIDANKGDNSTLSQRVYDVIKSNINDFKVFNSISNEYYYMDIPVTNNQDDYRCKLIIKDDRKSGKRVDSKNVKLITSVKTVNMGDVDAYISVLENNMNINLKCEKKWVKVFNKSKESIIGKISNMGYNINMNIDKKEDEEEVNIVTCRSFFNNNNFYSKIDVRV